MALTLCKYSMLLQVYLHEMISLYDSGRNSGLSQLTSAVIEVVVIVMPLIIIAVAAVVMNGSGGE